jgi:tetratricopeptide (TPR) repeat protein
VGGPPYPSEVRLFDLPQDPRTPFSAVLEELGDWEPDVVLFMEPGTHPLMPGLERSPYPVVTVGGDWQLNLGRLRDVAQVVDWILLDQWGADILRAGGVERVSTAYRYGTFVEGEVDLPAPEEERDLDLSLVSHWALPWNWERRRLMWGLAAGLGRTRRIHFAQRVYGPEYTRFIRRSKIVFMNNLRREFAYRCLEVLGGGAMLICEAENLEIRDFLTEGEHFVTYEDDAHLVEQVAHYLDHPEERRRIAAAGREQIRRYAYPYPLGFYAQRVLEVGLERLRGLVAERLQRAAPGPRDLARRAFQDGLRWRTGFQMALRHLQEAPDGDPVQGAADEHRSALCALGYADRLEDGEKALAHHQKVSALLDVLEVPAESPVGLAVVAFDRAEAAHRVNPAADRARAAYEAALERLRALPGVDPEGPWPTALHVQDTLPQFYVHAFSHGATWKELPARFRDLLAAWCHRRLGAMAQARGDLAAAADHLLAWEEGVPLTFHTEHRTAIEALVAAEREPEALALAERVQVEAPPLDPELWLLTLDLYGRVQPEGWAAKARALAEGALGAVASIPEHVAFGPRLEERLAALPAG